MKKLILLLFIPLVSFSQEDKDIRWIIDNYNKSIPIEYDMGDVTLSSVYVNKNSFYYSYLVNNCIAEKSNIDKREFLEIQSNYFLSEMNNEDNKWEFMTISKYYDIVFKYTCKESTYHYELRYKLNDGKFILSTNLEELL